MEALEQRIKSTEPSSSKCSWWLRTAPSRLKVVRCATSTETSALMCSIKETVVAESISIIFFDWFSIYQNRRTFDFVYNNLHQLSATSHCIVICCCTTLKDMLPFKFSRSPTGQLISKQIASRNINFSIERFASGS